MKHDRERGINQHGTVKGNGGRIMNNDLISREALKKAINNLHNETLDGLVKFGIEKAYKEIDKAPAITKGGKTDEQ